MKNRVLRILGAACLVLFISSSLTSCSVEDGVDGVNGSDGINGSDGADGADGSDGADGQNGADAIGLEEFANYGSIELKVQGTRPDNVAFDYETELEFISPQLYYNSFQERNPDLEFDFLRLVDAPNAEEVNGTWIYLDVNDAGLPTEGFDLEIEFSDFAIFSDDLKYISLSDSYSGSLNSSSRVVSNSGANTISITDYNFDDTTNNLKFSFTMDVDGASSETGHDLSIEGTVDVIVFENVNSRS